MSKINPKALDAIFDDSVLAALPTNNKIKIGVAAAKKAQDPTYLKNLKEGKERFWTNVDQSHRDHIAQKSFETSISFESKEQAHEIFWKCWGPDRGEKLYKKLAQEYNVGLHGIIDLVRGGFRSHAYCPVDPETLEQMKNDWQEKYQTYKVCAVIPGCDQLDNYDRLYKESGQYNKVKLAWKLTTPSVVFHCRFVLENPTPQTVRDYCDSIGVPRIKNDLGQYKTILFDKFPWLRKELSQTIEFDSYKELADFLQTHESNKTVRKVDRVLAHDYVKHRIQWRGDNFLGWMFYKKENEL